jgi:hypothetical protein
MGHLGRISAALILAAAFPIAAARAQAPSAFDLDPFAPGPRWSLAAPAAGPWLCRSLAFDGAGLSILAGLSGQTPGQALLGAQWELTVAGQMAPLLAARSAPASSSQPVRVAVAGGRRWSLSPEAPSGGLATARLERLDPALGAGALTAAISIHLAPLPEGPSRLIGTPPRLFLARLDPAGKRLWIEAREPEAALLLASRELSGAALRGLAASQAGDRLLLASDTQLWLFDGDLNLLASRALAQAPSALALSGDGRRIAVGGPAGVSLLDGTAADLALLWNQPNPAAHLPTALALDGDGSDLAAGYWQQVHGRGVRLERLNFSAAGALVGQQLLYQHEGPQLPLQNFVSAAAIAPGGERLAFGLWGQGGAEPELLVFAAPLFQASSSVSLPGSVEALELSPDGRRLALGHKAVHANQFGGAGQVRLFRLAPEPLALRQSLRPGATGRLALELPGAELGWLMLGLPGPPLPLAPPELGTLGLEPGSLAPLLPLLPEGGARFGLEFQLGAGAGLAGVTLAAQGLGWSAALGARLAQVAEPLALY